MTINQKPKNPKARSPWPKLWKNTFTLQPFGKPSATKGDKIGVPSSFEATRPFISARNWFWVQLIYKDIFMLADFQFQSDGK